MSCVVVLIADPAGPGLSPAPAEAVRRALGGAAPDWLAEGIACDIALPGAEGDRTKIEALAREALAGAPADVAVVPARHRRKHLLVADMDSTIIGQECIDEMGALLGIEEEIAAITERAMRGEIEFEGALRERVALLRGITLDDIRRILDERITLTPGALTLTATMRANGAYCALVSGGFTPFTSAIAALAGFDEHRANTLLIEDGRLSGHVAEPILGKDAKRARLVELLGEMEIGAGDSIAVGDGANDLDMLGAAGLGVAFRAKPAVAATADVRIDHGDLTALLYLQGYRRAEFTA